MPAITKVTGKMKYPKFLKEGGVIGCVAPSFGCNIEPYHSAFLHACNRFTQMGYGLDLGLNCFAGDGIGISSTPQSCGEELTNYYASYKNDILLSCGGGELMCEALDYVDFERLKAAIPKWYVGYSDNTNFTFLLTTILETSSIYAPCAPTFGMEPWHESIEDLWELLHGRKLQFKGYPLWEKESLKTPEQPLIPYHVTEPKVLRIFSDGEKEDEIFMEGRLLGGCMDCLVNLLGTNYDNVSNYIKAYQNDGFLWFLESCDLNVFGIRRAIWQMEHAGWFEHIRGVLIGRPYCFGEESMGLDQYHAVVDLLTKYHVPIIMDMDFGHLPPAMPMICGAYAKVQAKGNDVKIEYQLK
jgi:muramoyltetrapeptide carboxypeptidase LdcA involved in peptidoglycan recycling